VIQQPPIVHREKAFKRVGWTLDAAGLQRSHDERGGPVANHLSNLLLGNRLGAVRHQQFVGGIGDIAPRVDKRAIEVEDEQAEWLMADG
jgi:hypothetical protein